MINLKHLYFFIFILVCTVSCEQKISPEQISNIESTKKELSKEITRLLVETGMPSISIALIKNDSIIWAEAFGFSNVATQTTATKETVYSTGSIGKTVTATAIMQLVEKGEIELDKPINKYLEKPIKEFSEQGKSVTIRHLLCHLSGFPTSAEEIPLWDRKLPRTLEQIVNDMKPNALPETKVQYCNDCFSLLGLLIEKVTGVSYTEYIVENVLKPLEIENIGMSVPTPKMIEKLSMPYRLVYNKSMPTNPVRIAQYPAGDMYLTPSDMSKFIIAHLNEGNFKGKSLLGNKEVLQMHTSQYNKDFGLGFMVLKRNDKKYIWHNGGLTGYSTVFEADLENKTGVYLASNSSWTQGQLEALARKAIDLLEEKNNIDALPSFGHQEFKDYQLSHEQLEKYLGKYRIDGTDFNLVILKKNGKMFLKNPANAEFEISAYEQSKFYLKTEEEQIEFTKSGNTINGMILYSNGQEINATRTE